jgi:tellurite resistance protein
MNERIKYFPITAFAIVMGLSGLTIVFSKFYHLSLMNKLFFDVTLIFTTVVFLSVLILYLLKFVNFFEEVKTDFFHRIRINFFSAISISLLLLSIAYYAYWPIVSIPLWWLGLLLHSIIMFYTISFWFRHNFEIHAFNPAWFIPVVGNIIIPVVGVDFMPKAFSLFFFVVGFLFWIVLFVIFLYRVIFHDQLPQKFLPTLFILIAPPAVGFIGYMRIFQSMDLLAGFLLFSAYFFVLLLVFLVKSFKGLKFFISWWAFTFPLTAVTIASIVSFQVTSNVVYLYFSWLLFVFALLAVALASAKTIQKIYTKELCVKEE